MAHKEEILGREKFIMNFSLVPFNGEKASSFFYFVYTPHHCRASETEFVLTLAGFGEPGQAHWCMMYVGVGLSFFAISLMSLIGFIIIRSGTGMERYGMD
ncbi:hypothetical protein BJY04DRAFT_173704 [Aspergillus karnatakaensis]|uniref:uncharacterized protein n=1 Tax=Aspergillus karnatakaensis TaxID=1810916 RepID=UPI003CCD0932